MSIFDEKYDIRLANIEDIDAIMSFIDEHWRKGHILAANRAFFEYEFMEPDGTVNFEIAENKEDGSIEGIIGFLKASHSSDCLDIWDVMWRTKPGSIAFLGVELIKARDARIKPRNVLSVGDNPKTAVPIVKHFFNREICSLNHWYRLADLQEYKIAKIVDKKMPSISCCEDVVIEEIATAEELSEKFPFDEFRDTVPYKDAWYYAHRFFSHPVYKYRVFCISSGFEPKAVFVTRKQEMLGSSALRIVNFYGDRSSIAFIGPFISGLIEKESCEYADFWESGFDGDSLEKAGFVKVEEDDENIIPDYFYPFEQKNIEILADSSVPGAVFCKADGDQDRPN